MSTAAVPPPRTIRLLLEYDGRDFRGWQVQAAGRTVQGELERALHELTGETLRVEGSGRTDAGVHALGQVASFRTASPLPVERFAPALNAHLPPDVAVLEAREAAPDFHARFSARGKIYRYVILNRPARPAATYARVAHVPMPLDAAAMQRAGEALLGEHDFAAFATELDPGQSSVRTLRRLEVRREGERIVLEVEGNGFLRQMVRAIAGTLIEVGRGKLPPAAVAEVLASRDRRRAGPNAPPEGLYLVRVFYDDEASDKTPPDRAPAAPRCSSAPALLLAALLAVLSLAGSGCRPPETVRRSADRTAAEDPALAELVADGRFVPLGEFRLSFYWTPEEADYPGEAATPLYAPGGDVLGLYSAEFVAAVELEGCGRLSDGRVVTLEQRAAPERGGKPTFVFDDSSWGRAADGRPLVPFATLAADPAELQAGTCLYLPALNGIVVRGHGALHGQLTVHDTGSGVRGRKLDLFIGSRRAEADLEAEGVRSGDRVAVYRVVKRERATE